MEARDLTAIHRIRRRNGRLAFVPTEEQRDIVRREVEKGTPAGEIPEKIINPITGKPIGKQTLYRHFQDELDVGLPTKIAKVAECLYLKAVGGPDGNWEKCNVQAAIFYLKSRGGWDDRPVRPTDYDTPEIIDFDMSRLSDADLDTIRRAHEILQRSRNGGLIGIGGAGSQVN